MGRNLSCLFLVVTIALAILADEDETTSEISKKKDKKDRKQPQGEASTWFPNIDVLLKPAADILADLKYWKIIPDLLQEADAPKLPMQVEWVEGPEGLFGNIINTTVVRREPFWACWEANSTDHYTMILTGIDEKCQKHTKNKEKQFWIIGNIPEYDFIAGEYLTEYQGPTPPEGTGPHRYVFLVYKQPGKIEFKEPKIASTQDNRERTNFSSSLFAEKYNLGKPMAINFFRATFSGSFS